jgi:hypothetical protein
MVVSVDRVESKGTILGATSLAWDDDMTGWSGNGHIHGRSDDCRQIQQSARLASIIALFKSHVC